MKIDFEDAHKRSRCSEDVMRLDCEEDLLGMDRLSKS
jgi:hypothetical protein